MTKIMFNGAGSVTFTQELVADILGYEELADATIALYDIDAERLETAAVVAQRIADGVGAKPVIERHADRRAALDGADHVISMIRVGGHEGLKLDFEIPARYGVRQTMGDTLGLGSIFRGLCSIPPLLALARDMHEVCPDAWLFNYTNPMAALCWAVYAGTAHSNVVGVCMSAENTARELAELVGVPFEELSYLAAGMNHQAWMLRLEQHGEDLYPRLRERLDADPDGLGRRVRMEIFRRLGYFPTESSEHNADLVPWFLPHEGSVERYRLTIDEYVRRSERNLGKYEEMRSTLAEEAPPESGGEPEYAPQIIHSIETGAVREVIGNVRNSGLIENLPEDCCVEVPCLVDRAGVHPTWIGELPPQLAAVNRQYVNVTELTVRAALEGSREHVYHAAMLDPNTAATLTLEQIQDVCDELIDAHAPFMPEGIVRA
jgi:alpha-galactosidase